MAKITQKEISKFLELKSNLERAVVAKLKENGILKFDNKFAVDVEWMPWDSLLRVHLFNKNESRFLDMPIKDLVGVEFTKIKKTEI